MNIKRLTKSKIDVILEKSMNLGRSNELTSEQEMKIEKNLVWIFASPRSGTTWLANQLLSFNTLQMDEPHIGHHLASIGISENRKNFAESHKNRSTYFFCNLYKKNWIFFLRKLILNRIYVQYPDLSKKIIIKEPNGSLGADNVVECIPNSMIIILMRDGRDVVDSLVDAKKIGGWGTGNNIDAKPLKENQRIPFIKRVSNLWAIRTNLLFELYNNRPKNLNLYLKYEDLKQNTLDELRKIYNFIDIEIPEDELKKIVEKYSFENIPADKKGSGKVTRSASPGKWKENFSEEEQSIMQKIMGETLQKLGYS